MSAHPAVSVLKTCLARAGYEPYVYEELTRLILSIDQRYYIIPLGGDLNAKTATIWMLDDRVQ